MARVVVRGKGPAAELASAIPALHEVLGGRARIFFDDPTQLAQHGDGKFVIDVPGEGSEDSRAIARAALDQVPNGSTLFTVVGEE